MTKTPEELVAGLVRLLTVEPAGSHAYSGSQQPGGVGRVFGGQVVAQALQSAQAQAPADMEAHSLHAYFLRGGREGTNIDYAVAADFDGRSFANRRVVASQEGSPILNLTASFQRPEEGLEHEDSPMPDVAAPEELPSGREMRDKFLSAMTDLSDAQRRWMSRPNPIEMRTSGELHWMTPGKKPPRAYTWFRAAAPLPEDASLHRAVIAYASDYTLLGTAALPHGLSWARNELTGASLDHAVWFHRPARADEWLLYATDSPWSGGGRGFNRGRIFNREGQLVASVAQEGVIRKNRRS